MRIKKPNKPKDCYLSLDDLKKIDDDYLSEVEHIKRRVTGVGDENVPNTFYAELMNSYKTAIDIKRFERSVDYAIKFAEIEARAEELTPVRKRWRWFRKRTNRAQDIIEERAELDADIAHSVAEKQLDEDWRKFFPDTEKKLTKRERRRAIREKLQEVIKQADEKPTNEAFDEPAGVPALDVAASEPAQSVPTSKPATLSAQTSDVKPANAAKQLLGQMTLNDVQLQENAATPATEQAQQLPPRRPRPPRSCRRSAT